MDIHTIVRAGAILFAGLFVAAILHKVQVLASASAAAEPLIRTNRWRRAHATLVLTAALLIELGVAVLLVFRPGAGFGAAALLVVYYAFEMRRLPQGESCRCFGSLTRSKSSTSAVRRNVVLAGLATAGCVGYQVDAVDPVDVTGAVLGAALIGAAAALAPVAVQAFALLPKPAVPNPEEG